MFAVGHFRLRAASEPGPLVPRQRTCGDCTAMSVSCQQGTHAPQPARCATPHTKLESTVRNLGIEVDDALNIAEQIEL